MNSEEYEDRIRPPRDWKYSKYQIKWSKSLGAWGFWCPTCWTWFWALWEGSTYEQCFTCCEIHHAALHSEEEQWQMQEQDTRGNPVILDIRSSKEENP